MGRYLYDIYKNGRRIKTGLTTKEVKEFFGDKGIKPNEMALSGTKTNGCTVKFNREITDEDFLRRLSKMRNTFTAVTLKQWDFLHEKYGKNKSVTITVCPGVTVKIEVTENMKQDLHKCNSPKGQIECGSCAWNGKEIDINGRRTSICGWDKAIKAVMEGDAQ